MNHTILRGAHITLRAERPPHAPHHRYRAECLTCGTSSPRSDDNDRPTALWAHTHTHTRGLDHSHYLLTTHTFWRARPTTSPPPKPIAPISAPPPYRFTPTTTPTAPPATPAQRTAVRGHRTARLLGALALSVAARMLPRLGSRRSATTPAPRTSPVT